MKTLPVILGLSCAALLFTACEYDDEDHHPRRVSVSTNGYYGGDYDEYSPYYSYSGRRYYRTGSRYVYYTDNRPYYVTALPSSARYITPRRSHYRSDSSVRTYRQEPTVSRYDTTTSERRSYESRSDRGDWHERDGVRHEQRPTQTRVQTYPTREVRRETEPVRVRVPGPVPTTSSREIRREVTPSRVRPPAPQATVIQTDLRTDKHDKQDKRKKHNDD